MELVEAEGEDNYLQSTLYFPLDISIRRGTSELPVKGSFFFLTRFIPSPPPLILLCPTPWIYIP